MPSMWVRVCVCAHACVCAYVCTHSYCIVIYVWLSPSLSIWRVVMSHQGELMWIINIQSWCCSWINWSWRRRGGQERVWRRERRKDGEDSTWNKHAGKEKVNQEGVQQKYKENYRKQTTKTQNLITVRYILYLLVMRNTAAVKTTKTTHDRVVII